MSTIGMPAGAGVDPGFIAAHLGDPSTRIVEVDVSSAAYEAGHIPDAVLWNAYSDLRHPDYRRISHQELEELFRRSGISPETTVVTYGYGAHLGYWLLKSCGHDRAKLMDGPRDQWSSAGHEWSTDIPAPARSQYDLAGQESFIASEDDMLAMTGTTRGAILDVRSTAEYSGISFWPSGAPEAVGRAGHIPGAIHMPVDSLRTTDGTFVDTDVLRKALRDRAIDPSEEIVTYCTIGNRASQVWYALTVLLGYPKVRVYYGSWVEWGMDPDSPIET